MKHYPKTHVRVPIHQRAALILFGLFLTVIILEAGLRLGGFVLTSIQESRNWLSISRRGSFRIMCLGESTTAGQYPRFLEEILNQRDLGIKVSVIDKGASGTRTKTILDRLEANLDRYRPDMVITMMGINDGATHMPPETVSESKILDFFRSFRTYKLARSLWWHIINKLEGSGCFGGFFNRNDMIRVGEKNKDLSPDDALLKCKKTLESNPEEKQAHINLGDLYRTRGRFSESEEHYRKALLMDPTDYHTRVELGNSYRDAGRFSEARDQYRQAAALNPRHSKTYIEWGESYRDERRFAESEDYYKKAIVLDPQSKHAYIELAHAYWLQKKYPESEEYYKKAIVLDPRNAGNYYSRLGWSYLQREKTSDAEEYFKKVIELAPGDERAHAMLERIYRQTGREDLAKEYAAKAETLRAGYYDLRPDVADHYRKLKTILDQRGVVYVCVQYPLRDLKPLKRIFGNDADNIIYVDNEKIFKEALQGSSYNDYFRDSFAGDFGHCTDKGNRLLAENIANVLEENFFKKRKFRTDPL